jgi:hypothetical protein
MKSHFKLVAGLLLATVTLSPLGPQQLPNLRAAEHPVGCHGHGGKIPAPAPTSYHCCQTGHDAAALQYSYRFADLAAATQIGCFVEPVVAIERGHFDSLKPSFGYSPGSNPLRV